MGLGWPRGPCGPGCEWPGLPAALLIGVPEPKPCSCPEELPRAGGSDLTAAPGELTVNYGVSDLGEQVRSSHL